MPGLEGRYVRANPSTQQTNTSLVAARPNGAIAVRQVYVSSGTEMTVTLVNSETHDVLFRLYVGTRGGIVLPTSFWTRWAEGIDYTTSKDGNVFIQVRYNFVGR